MNHRTVISKEEIKKISRQTEATERSFERLASKLKKNEKKR